MQSVRNSIRGASPLGLPHTLSRAPLRRRAPLASLARGARSQLYIATGVLVATIGLRAQSAPRSVWDGVYTEEQAKRGAEVYEERCVRCHGETLMGGTDGAGALIGEKFNGNWNGVPLDQMIDRVRSSMPLDQPMTLSRQQTVDVMTYVFSANKIPAGKTELPRQAEMLSLIKYKATKQLPVNDE